MADQHVYKFNDYKSDVSDPGVAVVVKGIPMRIRHSVTLKEKQKAGEAAILYDFDNNGKPRIKSSDSSKFSIHIAKVALKQWPFIDDDGRPVPITEETLAVLDSSIVETISNFALGLSSPDDVELQDFEKGSDGR